MYFSSLSHQSSHISSTNDSQNHGMRFDPPTQRRGSQQESHDHKSLLDRHHLAEAMTSFLTHMFAPTGYLQCNSTSSWSQSAPYVHEISQKHTMVIAEEIIDPDGGPLCREAIIESWKETPCHTERKRSLPWLGAVINSRSSDHATK